MAFKMKRKGFPMKGESPNKIRDYSSAMDMKKEESPNKRLDIGVTRDGEEIMYDRDTGQTGLTRSKKVQDAVKKYEMANQKMVERNEEKASAELDKLYDEMQDMFDGKVPYNQKRFDEIADREKAIKEGNFEGGEKI